MQPGGTGLRRPITAANAPVLAASFLAVLAVIELIARLNVDPGSITRLGRDHSIALTATGGIGVQFILLLLLVGLATTLPVAFSRPDVAAVAVTLAAVLSLTVFQTLTLAGVGAQLIAGYRLGNSGARALAVVLGIPFLVLVLTDATTDDVRVLTVLLVSLFPAAAVAGFGQRSQTATQESTAARQVITSSLLEHTARGERARISRELHDVVAHHISMIAVQAETARLATPGMPAEGAQQLRSIGDTARAALTEMRRLLGVLREDIEADADEARQPQPSLRQLNELLVQARDISGGTIRLIVRGPPDVLDPGVELAAYRIIQECLTNARRHAPGAAVDVELHYTGETLHLRIRDNGPGPAARPAGSDGSPPDPGGSAPTGGHGLLGMRERSAAVGGQIRIGPAAGGGFLIEAVLPTKAEETG
jgi:signal transduction histidine kinase